MRPSTSLLLISLLAACHRPQEVRGLYLSDDDRGVVFSCTDSSTVFLVQDSTLHARHHALVSPLNQPVFVRIRAVQRDSGSIYGGQHFLDVREIVEVRLRTSGDCPGVAGTSLPLQTGF